MLRLAVALCLVGLAIAGPPVSRSRSEIEKFKDFLESTRKGRGAVTGKVISPQASVWENSGKYQGDILLDEEQIESMVQQFSEGRNAYIWPNTKWPWNTIPYEFAAGHFNNAQRDYVLFTMRLIEEKTCIRFRPRNPGEFNYALLTTHPDGCYANVGYWDQRGAHTINLARDVPGRGCFQGAVIVHEWLHIIGFFHMQSTYNRYDYVRINWENIHRGMEYNFHRYEPNMVSNMGLPYEYDSCMHYGPYAFSINGRRTMDALRHHHGEMGQTSYVTAHDFWRVDRHYGCVPWRKAEDYKPFYFDDIVSDVETNEEKEETLEVNVPEPVISEIPEPVKIAVPELP